MNNLALDCHDPVALRAAGLEALNKELGPLGTVLFMRQYDKGYGNYTEERDALLGDLSFEDIERELAEMRK